MQNIEESAGERIKRDLKQLWNDILILLRDFWRLFGDLFVFIAEIPWINIYKRCTTGNSKWISLSCIVLLLIVVTIATCDREDTAVVDETVVVSTRVERPQKAHRISSISYRRNFNDMNDEHLSAAKKIGIKPLASRDEISNASRHLVKTDDYAAYKVDKLTHSVPYLVPEGAELLSRIGCNFQDSLVMKHLPPCKLIVTSVLRTQSDVKRLGRGNVNASKNSAHCYATTFDITYKRFEGQHGETTDNAGKMKAVLGEVLRDLKKAGYCYVKHEIKQACFHITVRKGF